MSNKIFRSICLITMLVLIASLFFIMGSTYEYFSENQEQHIWNQLELVCKGAELSEEEYFDNFDIEGVRVTWIAADGTVLFDNETDPAEMGNHLERPEVKQAIESGKGESSRYSSTLLQKQIYCAKQLNDGSIIRISDNQSTVLTLLLAFAQPICLIIIVIIIMAFFVARNVSRRIVEPINSIDLDNPMEADTYSELKPLLSRLALQQNQLKRDKTELEKTEQIRQEFTSNVSHELKTPLHAISGYAELMKNDLVAEEDIKPFAGKIYDESNRLAQLVEDVIDLSKLDSRVPGLESEVSDLYLIAENAVESLEEFAGEKNVMMSLKGETASFKGIPQLLHSIVYNLCDNAIKYNKEGGSVDIEISDAASKVVLKVTDSGIGIPQEHIERIFERFYRVDKSHSKDVGGTGLGLSIVKHAAALHSATIDVSSIVDQGTTITITFPKY